MKIKREKIQRSILLFSGDGGDRPKERVDLIGRKFVCVDQRLDNTEDRTQIENKDCFSSFDSRLLIFFPSDFHSVAESNGFCSVDQSISFQKIHLPADRSFDVVEFNVQPERLVQQVRFERREPWRLRRSMVR